MAAPTASVPPSTAQPSAADTIATPQHSSSASLPNSSKTFLTTVSPAPSVPRSPMFSAQPLLGKPINPPVPPPPQSHGILYPLGNSIHRGFPVRAAGSGRTLDHLVTVANPAGYLRNGSPMAVMNFAAAMAAASQSRPYLYSGVEHTAATAAAAAVSHGMRPPPSQEQQQSHHFVVPRPGVSRGASAPAHPHPKWYQSYCILHLDYIQEVSRIHGGGIQRLKRSYLVTSLPTMPSVPEQSDTKERGKNIDDAFVMIHGRKVRLADGGSGSLYALCRSWIRNGLTQESHPNVGEGVKLLPKPLPPSVVERMLNNKKDDKGDEEIQEDKIEDFVEQLSSQELLAGHLKRAKRVRARFRRERLLRIERYKQRLSLLLPAPNDLVQAIATTPGSS